MVLMSSITALAACAPVLAAETDRGTEIPLSVVAAGVEAQRAKWEDVVPGVSVFCEITTRENDAKTGESPKATSTDPSITRITEFSGEWYTSKGKTALVMRFPTAIGNGAELCLDRRVLNGNSYFKFTGYRDTARDTGRQKWRHYAELEDRAEAVAKRRVSPSGLLQHFMLDPRSWAHYVPVRGPVPPAIDELLRTADLELGKAWLARSEDGSRLIHVELVSPTLGRMELVLDEEHGLILRRARLWPAGAEQSGQPDCMIETSGQWGGGEVFLPKRVVVKYSNGTVSTVALPWFSDGGVIPEEVFRPDFPVGTSVFDARQQKRFTVVTKPPGGRQDDRKPEKGATPPGEE